MEVTLTYYPARVSPDGVGQQLPIGGELFGGITPGGSQSPPLCVGPAAYSEQLWVSGDFGSHDGELPPEVMFDEVAAPDGSVAPPDWIVVDCQVGKCIQRTAMPIRCWSSPRIGMN